MEKLVDNYFLNGGNKKEAFYAAGYGDYDTYGYKVFKTPGVTKLIADRKNRLRKRFEVKFETIIDELAEIVQGYKRLAKYKKVDDKGLPYWDFTGATEEDLAFITTMDTEVSFEENDKEGESPIQVRKVKISTADIKDAKNALDSLAKLIGVDKQRVEISGPDGKPIEIDNKELARKLAFILTKGAEAPEQGTL
jgi:hypothetical protein